MIEFVGGLAGVPGMGNRAGVADIANRGVGMGAGVGVGDGIGTGTVAGAETGAEAGAGA